MDSPGLPSHSLLAPAPHADLRGTVSQWCLHTLPLLSLLHSVEIITFPCLQSQAYGSKSAYPAWTGRNSLSHISLDTLMSNRLKLGRSFQNHWHTPPAPPLMLSPWESPTKYPHYPCGPSHHQGWVPDSAQALHSPHTYCKYVDNVKDRRTLCRRKPAIWSTTPPDSPGVLENSHSSVTSLEQG